MTLKKSQLVLCLLPLLLVMSCGEASPPVQLPPTPTPLAVTLFTRVLAGEVSAGGELTIAAYVLADAAGVRLVDGLSFSAGVTPQPLSSAADQIWLGADLGSELNGKLQVAGSVQYAVVIAQGRLQGPGAYGPGGVYRYRISASHLQPLAPEETTIAALIEDNAAAEGRFVRVVGALLARDDAALLVERLGAGGLPEPKARQIKLQAPLRDAALLARLHGAAGGAIRFGQVQIEGLWRDGQLIPLAIFPVT